MTLTNPIPNWPALTTEQRRAIVKPLWDAGNSASEVMRHFVGATRNAIIGLVNRAGWQRAPHIAQENSNRMNKARRKAVPNPPKPKRPVGRPPVPPSEPAQRMDWINSERPPLAGTTPIRLVDLPAREGVLCRFPVVGGYCGQPSGESMYCEAHHRFMYTPRKESERAS